jgi:signal transduction histidine kinase
LYGILWVVLLPFSGLLALCALLAALVWQQRRLRRLTAEVERTRVLVEHCERLANIGSITAGLAHEIRNPLVSIRAFTQMLPERFDDAEFRNQFLDLTLSEVDRVCALLNELLDLARPASSELAEVCVNDCLGPVCTLVETQAHSRGIHVQTDFEESLPRVWANADQLKQLAMNLLLNAVDACGPNGQVTVRSYQEGGDVCIEVRDDGPGIEAEHLDKIFEPFFTTRPQGTGLGLSIAKQIVDRHGGLVTVESRPGAGTSFFVRIPAAGAQAVRKQYLAVPDDVAVAGGVHG